MLSHILSVEQSPLLKINNIGCSADPDNNRFGPGIRNIYLIHYVVNGKGYYNGNPVMRGQGFLINKGQLEEYYPDKDDPWEYLWITSEDDAFGELFKYYNADPKTLIFNYTDIFTIENTMRFIKSNHNLIMSASEILERFLHIFNSHIYTFEKRQLNADIYFDFSLNYIKTNLHNAISVNDLVEALGISSAYLLKIFKAKTDLSPKQYINELRVSNAKKLLTETDMTVTQIANSVGYDNVLAFSRFFRSKSKSSPLQYRKKFAKHP